MAKAQVSIVINRPARDVFAYMTGIDKETAWQADVLEAEQTSTGPMSVGTTVREVRRFMGRRMEVVSEITEFEPDKKCASRVSPHPSPCMAGIAWSR